jgi:peroxiredoxin
VLDADERLGRQQRLVRILEQEGLKHAWIALLILGTTAQAQTPAPLSFSGTDVVQGTKTTIALKASPQPTVVVFVSALCPCSAAHEDALRDLAKEFQAAGVRFVGIHSNQNESPEKTREHFGATKLGFPVLQDPGAAIADQLGALKTPHAFVLNSDGKILYQGGVDDSHEAATAKKFHLRDALLALLQGKPVPAARTRALGCMISRH